MDSLEDLYGSFKLTMDESKNIWGSLLDDGGDACGPQVSSRCPTGEIMYHLKRCKKSGDWVESYCVHPDETVKAGTHPATTNFYECWEPSA